MHIKNAILLVIPFLLFTSSMTWAGQVANYEFQSSLASSDGNTASLVDLGSGTFVTDSVLGQECTVLNFAEQTGLSLDVTGLFGSSAYSFVAMMRFAETYEYAKILDIQDRVEDEGLYAYEYGLLFYDYSNNGLDQLSNDIWAQVVFAYDGSILRGYVNGVEAFAETDTYNDGEITSNTLFFFRDDLDTSDSENSAGRVANIQLYDHALSAQEIGAITFNCGNNGPGLSLPTQAVAIPTVSAWGKIGIIFVLMLAGIGYARRFTR